MAYKPITELAHLIRTRNLSPVELTDLYLERIGQYDGALKSYITVVPESARREAQEAERALKQGADVGPLHGIPLAYKDEFYTKGVRTTCGSVILSEFVPDYDATTVAKLHEAGAVMLGKLNMTEWATPLTLKFPYGQPCNPWNVEHDAGGSSTGSGSATAAALCAGALGEDTGGSIEGNSLADGRYTLTALATHIPNLDGNGDGTAGDDYTRVGTPANGLFRLFGDADGNGGVDALDFGAFRAAFGTNNSAFDFDGGGAVDALDFGQFRLRFGTELP